MVGSPAARAIRQRALLCQPCTFETEEDHMSEDILTGGATNRAVGTHRTSTIAVRVFGALSPTADLVLKLLARHRFRFLLSSLRSPLASLRGLD